MTDRELILKQISKKGNGSCKKIGKIYRSRGEFYAPKSVNRSFAARLWAANKDSAPENFTRYIQTHCKSRAILYGKLRVPLFQGGVRCDGDCVSLKAAFDFFSNYDPRLCGRDPAGGVGADAAYRHSTAGLDAVS